MLSIKALAYHTHGNQSPLGIFGEQLGTELQANNLNPEMEYHSDIILLPTQAINEGEMFWGKDTVKIQAYSGVVFSFLSSDLMFSLFLFQFHFWRLVFVFDLALFSSPVIRWSVRLFLGLHQGL